MQKNVMRILSSLAIAVVFVGFLCVLPTGATADATIFVDPANNVFTSPPMVVGSTFTVNVTIANITGLAGAQFHLAWDPALLSCVGMQEILFHTVTPSGSWDNIFAPVFKYNNTDGHAEYGVTWLDLSQAEADGYAPANVTMETFPPEGKLALAMFTMRVEKVPPSHGSVSCVLHLSTVSTWDCDINPIPLTVVDGSYTLNWTAPATVPYFSVDPPTYNALNAGEVFNISVRGNDLDVGWEAIAFEFKLSYNSTLLQVLNVFEGPWLPPYGAPPNQGTIFPSSLTPGLVHAGDMVIPDENGTWHEPFPQGSGVMAIVQFNATMQGGNGTVLSCALHLYDTIGIWWGGGAVPTGPPVDGLYNIGPDPNPPSIADIANVPLIPNYDGEVTVSCTIEDDYGVDEAFLSYLEGSEWFNVSMGRFSDLFNATAPPQPYGSLVQYKIYANDTSGNWAVSTVCAYSVGDFVNPEILSLDWKPVCPDPFRDSNVTRQYEPTTVYVNASEHVNASGVAYVLLSYCANGVMWNTSLPYNATSGLWNVQIPGYTANTHVEFYAVAYDNAGNSIGSSTYSFDVQPLIPGDINGDGVVNILDSIIVGNHFLQHYP